jgi:hypothetical protein
MIAGMHFSARRSLLPHPATPVAPDWRVDFACEIVGDTLQLEYALPARGLRFTAGPAGRQDSLWEHTCAELFIAGADGRYREFNFAPHGAWACYDFNGYRSMRDARPELTAPTVSADRSDDGAIQLRVGLERAALPQGAARIGATAVLESEAGVLSYWALHHPAEAADFHAAGGFVLELQAS